MLELTAFPATTTTTPCVSRNTNLDDQILLLLVIATMFIPFRYTAPGHGVGVGYCSGGDCHGLRGVLYAGIGIEPKSA